MAQNEKDESNSTKANEPELEGEIGKIVPTF